MAESWSMVAQARGASFFGQEAVTRHFNLMVGQPLLLVREPTNPVDPENSVRVLDLFGQPLGYVQRPNCAEVALRMDQGVALLAVVKNAPYRVGKGRFRVADIRIWSGGDASVDESVKAGLPVTAKIPELVD